MSRARRPFLVTLALLAGVVACSGTGTADTIAPITGVVVRAETLTQGRGCGRGATQIFKYAAVVLGKNPTSGAFDTFVAGNVYDCFSDGQFVELPASGGSFEYDIQIHAYNEAAYVAAGDAQVRFAASSPTNLPPTNPTFTTTCKAVQLELVQSLAVCQPFSVAAAPASVVLGATTFATAEAGVVTCDNQFVSVRYRSLVNGTMSEVTEARCGTITISPALAPASYVIEVALLRVDGTVLGQTTCGAETSPGLASPAACKPIQ